MYVLLVLIGTFVGYVLLLPFAIRAGVAPAIGWAIILLYAMIAWLFGGEPQVTTLRDEPYPRPDFKEYLEGTLAANGGNIYTNSILAYLIYPGVLYGMMLHNLDVKLSRRPKRSA